MGNDTTKKPIYKRWWFWAIAVFLFLGFIGSLNPSNSSVSSPNTQNSPEAMGNTQEAAKPSQPPSTIDQLWSAVDRTIKTRQGIDIHYFPDDGNSVILTQTVDNVWDENALVRKAYADLVYFGGEAFKLDNVEDVQVALSASFTDQYGKSDYKQAVRIKMTKDEFLKYDWKNLKYKPIWQQMKQSASDYYIYPGIIKGIDMSKLYLEANP